MLGAQDRRGPTARRGMTVLGKIPSVPKPVNLPSQRLENRGLDPHVELVPRGTVTWSTSGRSPPVNGAWGGAGLSPTQEGARSSSVTPSMQQPEAPSGPWGHLLRASAGGPLAAPPPPAPTNAWGVAASRPSPPVSAIAAQLQAQQGQQGLAARPPAAGVLDGRLLAKVGREAPPPSLQQPISPGTQGPPVTAWGGPSRRAADMHHSKFQLSRDFPTLSHTDQEKAGDLRQQSDDVSSTSSGIVGSQGSVEAWRRNSATPNPLPVQDWRRLEAIERGHPSVAWRAPDAGPPPPGGEGLSVEAWRRDAVRWEGGVSGPVGPDGWRRHQSLLGNAGAVNGSHLDGHQQFAKPPGPPGHGHPSSLAHLAGRLDDSHGGHHGQLGLSHSQDLRQQAGMAFRQHPPSLQSTAYDVREVTSGALERDRVGRRAGNHLPPAPPNNYGRLAASNGNEAAATQERPQSHEIHLPHHLNRHVHLQDWASVSEDEAIDYSKPIIDESVILDAAVAPAAADVSLGGGALPADGASHHSMSYLSPVLQDQNGGAALQGDMHAGSTGLPISDNGLRIVSIPVEESGLIASPRSNASVVCDNVRILKRTTDEATQEPVREGPPLLALEVTNKDASPSASPMDGAATGAGAAIKDEDTSEMSISEEASGRLPSVEYIEAAGPLPESITQDAVPVTKPSPEMQPEGGLHVPLGTAMEENPPVDAYDYEAQRAKLKEIAVQKAAQLRQLQERRSREQRARAQARAEAVRNSHNNGAGNGDAGWGTVPRLDTPQHGGHGAVRPALNATLSEAQQGRPLPKGSATGGSGRRLANGPLLPPKRTSEAQPLLSAPVQLVDVPLEEALADGPTAVTEQKQAAAHQAATPERQQGRQPQDRPRAPAPLRDPIHRDEQAARRSARPPPTLQPPQRQVQPLPAAAAASKEGALAQEPPHARARQQRPLSQRQPPPQQPHGPPQSEQLPVLPSRQQHTATETTVEGAEGVARGEARSSRSQRERGSDRAPRKGRGRGGGGRGKAGQAPPEEVHQEQAIAGGGELRPKTDGPAAVPKATENASTPLPLPLHSPQAQRSPAPVSVEMAVALGEAPIKPAVALPLLRPQVASQDVRFMNQAVGGTGLVHQGAAPREAPANGGALVASPRSAQGVPAAKVTGSQSLEEAGVEAARPLTGPEGVDGKDSGARRGGHQHVPSRPKRAEMGRYLPKQALAAAHAAAEGSSVPQPAVAAPAEVAVVAETASSNDGKASVDAPRARGSGGGAGRQSRRPARPPAGQRQPPTSAPTVLDAAAWAAIAPTSHGEASTGGLQVALPVHEAVPLPTPLHRPARGPRQLGRPASSLSQFRAALPPQAPQLQAQTTRLEGGRSSGGSAAAHPSPQGAQQEQAVEIDPVKLALPLHQVGVKHDQGQPPHIQERRRSHGAGSDGRALPRAVGADGLQALHGQGQHNVAGSYGGPPRREKEKVRQARGSGGRPHGQRRGDPASQGRASDDDLAREPGLTEVQPQEAAQSGSEQKAVQVVAGSSDGQRLEGKRVGGSLQELVKEELAANVGRGRGARGFGGGRGGGGRRGGPERGEREEQEGGVRARVASGSERDDGTSSAEWGKERAASARPARAVINATRGAVPRPRVPAVQEG
eukprot:SM000121S26021  [mRNA]  locus=s121:411789:418879:- [translate_table: standard]